MTAPAAAAAGAARTAPAAGRAARGSARLSAGGATKRAPRKRAVRGPSAGKRPGYVDSLEYLGSMDTTKKVPKQEPPASRERERKPAPRSSSSSSGGSVVNSGAGVVLAVLAWVWVGLPFLRGGPTEVKRVLKAKFTNRAVDGSWLP